eukprot:TRINITY_DN15258_c0_g2_i3.p1 TRINITY_DN15258_c0_g2~~TRINITY_DN15258_c0_g2_i3.p1  ORF type:complete len:100 (-),score=8.44 TRINITY_DN15258_c0_g2_i3:492-791(-)
MCIRDRIYFLFLIDFISHSKPSCTFSLVAAEQANIDHFLLTTHSSSIISATSSALSAIATSCLLASTSNGTPCISFSSSISFSSVRASCTRAASAESTT